MNRHICLNIERCHDCTSVVFMSLTIFFIDCLEEIYLEISIIKEVCFSLVNQWFKILFLLPLIFFFLYGVPMILSFIEFVVLFSSLKIHYLMLNMQMPLQALVTFFLTWYFTSHILAYLCFFLMKYTGLYFK